MRDDHLEEDVLEVVQGINVTKKVSQEVVRLVHSEDVDSVVVIEAGKYQFLSSDFIILKLLISILYRFVRRSPFRGNRNFRDRFRRSRSSSRGFERKDRRRFDNNRRSRSGSPQDSRMNNYRQQQQQQQQPQMNYTTDPYNFMQNVPQPPSFGPAMNQFNSYEFQANYPPAPNFTNIPAPPGISSESWIPQQSMPPAMPEESEEEKRKREGMNV